MGARPVFVDVDLDTRKCLLDAVEAAITPRTRAILPVHFSGLPLDLDALYALAQRHDLRVIEDAAHAIGSTLARASASAVVGDLVCFSFHPEQEPDHRRRWRDRRAAAQRSRSTSSARASMASSAARPAKWTCCSPGMKANMSDIAACIGLGQLARLDEFNARRRQLADRYFELWSQRLPVAPAGARR